MGRWVTSKGRRIYIPDEGEENPYANKPDAQKTGIKSDDKIKPYAVYQPEKILGKENHTRLSIKYAKSEKEAIEQYKKDYPKAKDIGIHESKAPEHQKKAEQLQKESTTAKQKKDFSKSGISEFADYAKTDERAQYLLDRVEEAGRDGKSEGKSSKEWAEQLKKEYGYEYSTKLHDQISKDQDEKEKQIARNKKEAEIRSDKYADDEHKPTGMGEMKKGEFFKLSNKPNGKVYVKGEYDKSEKAYWCYEYYDVNSGRYFKKGKTVYTGFTF